MQPSFTGIQTNTLSVTCLKAFDHNNVVPKTSPEDTVGDDGVVISLISRFSLKYYDLT
jgi:hypothetical protein